MITGLSIRTVMHFNQKTRSQFPLIMTRKDKISLIAFGFVFVYMAVFAFMFSSTYLDCDVIMMTIFVIPTFTCLFISFGGGATFFLVLVLFIESVVAFFIVRWLISLAIKNKNKEETHSDQTHQQ
jgi:hypothetical protein